MTGYIMEGPAEARRIRDKTSPLLARHHLSWAGLRPGESFVDFGCATGEVMQLAARITAPNLVAGIDASQERLTAAQLAAEEEGLTGISYVRATVGAPGSTPLPGGHFDHAWSRFLLEYLPDPLGCVEEMSRVVRPGGKVTIIDIDGNCIWHYPTTQQFETDLAEIMTDLEQTGFDPRIGSKLADLAKNAGLTDIRVAIEPYHRIVGRPDDETWEPWKAKINGIKTNYVNQLFPHKAVRGAAFFDVFLDFLAREDTMTWSNLYLVQGRKREH
jgi:ubiquinone/menaquinone biosynthesis C-methylase UbiE